MRTASQPERGSFQSPTLDSGFLPLREFQARQGTVKGEQILSEGKRKGKRGHSPRRECVLLERRLACPSCSPSFTGGPREDSRVPSMSPSWLWLTAELHLTPKSPLHVIKVHGNSKSTLARADQFYLELVLTGFVCLFVLVEIIFFFLSYETWSVWGSQKCPPSG